MQPLQCKISVFETGLYSSLVHYCFFLLEENCCSRRESSASDLPSTAELMRQFGLVNSSAEDGLLFVIVQIALSCYMKDVS